MPYILLRAFTASRSRYTSCLLDYSCLSLSLFPCCPGTVGPRTYQRSPPHPAHSNPRGEQCPSLMKSFGSPRRTLHVDESGGRPPRSRQRDQSMSAKQRWQQNRGKGYMETRTWLVSVDAEVTLLSVYKAAEIRGISGAHRRP